MRATFGDRELNAILTREADGPAGRSVEVAISDAELHRDPPDLSARFRLHDHGSTTGRYGGYVTDLERGPRGWWLLRSENLAHLADHLTGGIVVRNISAIEVLWSTLRGSGFPAKDLRMKWDAPLEPFRVVVPVEGLAPIEGSLTAGAITITGDRSLLSPFGDIDHAELRPLFSDAEQWITMTIASRKVFDAEQEAVGHFERVVARLALAARYSSAELPSRELRPFQRKQLLERIKLVHVAGVLGHVTGRQWLRGYAHPKVVEPTGAGFIRGVAEYIGASDRRIDDAIAAWRRATSEDDPAVAVVAIGEAIELYAAGLKVPAMFTKRELADLRDRLPENLSEAKAERVRLKIDGLNEPPLATRFRAALDGDGVRLSAGEFDLLLEVRGMRNMILHGKERKLPTEHQLNQATALVNRMLLYRLKRLRLPGN